MKEGIRLFFRRFFAAVLVLALLSGTGFAGFRLYRTAVTRRETLKALKELTDGEEDIRRWTEDAEERFSHYSLTEQEKESFDNLIVGGQTIGAREYDRQAENGDVVDDVVIGTLGKGAVDVAEGQQAVLGHSR